MTTKKIKTLQKEIKIITKKMYEEKQINIQCDIHKELLKKEKELVTLLNEVWKWINKKNTHTYTHMGMDI